MIFLNEVSVITKIREILDASDKARLAVAFWGNGATEQLGLTRRDIDLEIMCNLQSGACNPAEIRKLISKVGSEKVGNDPRLHAKVYWTPKAAIVGSSNASANGLVTEDALLSGWAEANILVEDPGVLRTIAVWLDERWTACSPVSEQDLIVAGKLWRKRRKLSAPGICLTGDLLASYRQTPGHPAWAGIRLCLWTSDIDNDGRREKAEAEKKDIIPRGMGAYQNLKKEIRAGEWLIEFKITSEESKYIGIYKIPAEKLETKTLIYAWPKNQVDITPFGSLCLNENDRTALEKVARQLFDEAAAADDTVVFIDLAWAVATLDRPANTELPDPDVFEQVLRENHTAARAVGYNTTGFLNMLDRDEGFGSAPNLGPPNGLSTT